MSAAIPEDGVSILLHELKTPISVIFGYAELLEHRSAEEATREAARYIRQAAEQLRATVDQLRTDAAQT